MNAKASPRTRPQTPWALFGDVPQVASLATVFVVDDDPLFRWALHKAAKRKGIALQMFDPNTDFYDLPSDGIYDVAIIDYDLGELRGTQISALYRETSVLLVSGRPRGVPEGDYWPCSIRGYYAKEHGLDGILREAMRLSAMNPA